MKNSNKEEKKQAHERGLIAKKIAEFEGYRTDENSIYYSDDNERHYTDTAYHNDWNWLMPVVDKINGILDDEEEFKYNVIIDAEKVIIFGTDIEQEHGSTLFEMVYLAVVQFIEQYKK